MNVNPRMYRIAQQIQQELGALLASSQVSDPRFALLSITGVTVSKDMVNATVLISQPDVTHIQETVRALNKASGFFRRALAHSLNLRITPKLHFIFDATLEQGARIAKLLDQAPTHPDHESTENAKTSH